MSADITSASEQTTIDPSIYWERSGVLARASSEGALFSLYLAMQQHSVAEPFEIEVAISSKDDARSMDAQLASLNHYRRPSLSANESAWENMQVYSSIASKDFENARLFLHMKPLPLAQTDDAKRLPDDVVQNCSLSAQKRLKKQYGNTLKEDNTILYDILSAQGESRATNESNNKQAQAGWSSFENIA